MHSRVFLGVGAWLLGAAAATGGSLLAVSALGQGMTPAAGQQLSVNAVNRALASEAVEQPGMPQRSLPRAAPSAVPSPRTTRHRSRPSSPSPVGGTVLTSRGGSVVADCVGTRAHLVSWSPGQGFEVARVIRGPAATARATFTDRHITVTMVVSCDRGVPTASSSVTSNGGGDE